MADDQESRSRTKGEGVRVSLRGADISPIKTATMKNLVYLQRRLMEDGDLIETDSAIETEIVNNGLGTMHGFVDALKHRDRDEARAAWNDWWKERIAKGNGELFEFAQRTMVDITFDLKETGMLDLREKPRPKRSGTGMQDAYEELRAAEGEHGSND